MDNEANKEDERILEVYLAEYKHVSASILGSEDGRRQMVNVVTAVIVASVSAVTIFQSQPILYLFGSLLLSLLTWIMVEETARTGIHNRYLRLVLGPKIQKLLKSYHSHVLQYTEFAFDFNTSTVTASALAPAKYLIGLVVSIIFFSMFLVQKNTTQTDWSFYESLLFSANIFSFSFPVVLGLINIITLSLKPVFTSVKRKLVKNELSLQQESTQPGKRQSISNKARKKISR